MGKMKDILIDMMNEDWERCHLTDEVFRIEMQREQELALWNEINKEDGTKEVQTNPGFRVIAGRVSGTSIPSREDRLLPPAGTHEVRKSFSVTGKEGDGSIYEQPGELRSDSSGDGALY